MKKVCFNPNSGHYFKALKAGGPWRLLDPGALHFLGDEILAQANTLGFQNTFLALGTFAFCGLIPA